MTLNKNTGEKDLLEAKEWHSSSSGIYFKIKKQLYCRNSPYQKIEVIENDYFGKVLLLDDLVQTTEKDEFFYHEMLVHPACITHPSPSNFLIIGGGDGGVLKEILRYPIKHVSLVEIDGLVVEVSKKYFPWLLPSLKNERVKLVIADGREFIEQTDLKFDIVVIDSSDPIGPSAFLHERGFYEKLKRHLSPNAIVVAQVGSPFYHLELIEKNHTFLKEIFQIVSFYFSPVPTYPGGSWTYVFLSDESEPLYEQRDPPEGLKFFNLDIHRASFSLPNFLKEKLGLLDRFKI